MNALRFLTAVLCFGLLLDRPAFATNLVTGNGFGFAVVSPQTASVTKFYVHPYSFVRPDPQNSLSEGIETGNFLKSLGWGDSALHASRAEYEDDSHVIHVRNSAGEGFFFMPFGFPRPALIVSWQSRSEDSLAKNLSAEWSHAIKSRTTVPTVDYQVQLLKFEGIDEALLLIPLGTPQTHPASQNLLATNSAWALVAVDSENDLAGTIREFEGWRSGLSPRQLAKREVEQLDQWRAVPSVQFKSENERHLWRQSEVMLRMAQSREQNRAGRNSNGLIVASLPDGVWFTPWVRDMAWAAVALARMGHRDEARAALLAYFNAQPTGKMRAQTANTDYQISVVRYFGNGSEEPFFTEEGSNNIEFDDWGEALWVLGQYLKKYDDPNLLRTPTYRGPLYESARDYIVKPLLANLETYKDGQIVAADTSIWEERQKDKKHFAFSTAAAIVGLQNFSEIAQHAGDESTRADVIKHLNLLEKGFDAAFIRDGELHGTLEEGIKNDIDGALLPIIHFGVVMDPALVRNTVDRMELLKVASGGYRRVRSTYTDPAIFEYWYERQEFLFVDISLAEVYRGLGRIADADAIIARIVSKAAADHNIIPEMYVSVPCKLFPGKIGNPTGARPMVGYGAGIFILDLLDREPLRR
ncbi:glycoside hydrolase family 15 protein [Telmatobacter sp. DSM 110680]|uniref:Glycoside hydrolase family 15 protein n=1 Tax=Telmatobacter sp. DSM 110680 TaxID=3036704 RepID=A0AAU7DIU7_9BACT